MYGFAVHSLDELDPRRDGDKLPWTRRRSGLYVGKVKRAAVHDESSCLNDAMPPFFLGQSM